MEKDLKEFALIRLPRQDNQIHLYLAGEVGLYSAPEISAELVQILHHIQPGDQLVVHFEKIVMNLQDGREAYSSGATFCDEACVELMIRMWREIARKAGRVIMIISDPVVRRTFDIKRISTLIRIVGDESELSE